MSKDDRHPTDQQGGAEQVSEIDQALADASVQLPWRKDVAFLIQMPGIGLVHAMTILSAIGTIERFDSPRQLVGYAGLGARVHSSGKKTRTGRIAKLSCLRELRADPAACSDFIMRFGDEIHEEPRV